MLKRTQLKMDTPTDDELRTSGLRSRYRMFDEFNEKDQTKLFQVMGLLGFFRRKSLPRMGFESACVLLLVAQRQSEGKTTTHSQWQKMLGLKGDDIQTVFKELGFPTVGYSKASKPGSDGTHHQMVETENGLFRLQGKGPEEVVVSLTLEGKQTIEELSRLLIFKD
ncbi:hypothetical protein [Limnobacter sp.]|uniref:hypothetical protein n=1 Tax=Limnobacter sp. TaxID=2003368 RepID=UPI0035141805